jgi:lipopolysaccharide export system permease protein
VLGILERSILFELTKVFLLSLVGITGILVMAGIVAEASQQGLSPLQVVEIIPLLVPTTLPYTIPATTLFATCVVYGRLSADNEILAIKAAGINILQVVRPGITLGLLMSVTTMGLYYKLIPYTQMLLRSQFLNEVEDTLYGMLRKDRSIKQPGLNYCIFVRQVQGHRLLDALFKRRDPRTNQYDVIAQAREAELKYDANEKQIQVTMKYCNLFTEKGDSAGYVHQKMWPVPLPPELGENKTPKPRAMSFPQLLARRRLMQQQVDAMAAQQALAVARLAMSNPPADLPQHLENLKVMQHQYQQEIYSLSHEIQIRPSLSFGCLCFVLIGCPVGIWFSRSDYLSAFISCFLPIVFLYYPMVLCGTNLAKQGHLPAEVALWAPDGLMALCALVLFWRLMKN